MNIQYSLTAYVQVPTRAMMDQLENELNGWACGDSNFCINRESLAEYIDEYDALDFLIDVNKNLKPGAGDVIFHL